MADDERTEMVVPLLAKQSMEGRCLALQFSPTLVRLVHMQKPARASDCPPRRPMASQTPISPESFPDADVSSNPSTPTQLQWTIDLAPTTDSGPFVVASAPSTMPTQNDETAAFSSAAGQGQGPPTTPAAAVGAFATFLRRRRVPSGGGVGAQADRIRPTGEVVEEGGDLAVERRVGERAGVVGVPPLR